MNGRSPHPAGPGGEESLDVAARRLQEEMEIALRHLREQVRGWRRPPERLLGEDGREPGGPYCAPRPGREAQP